MSQDPSNKAAQTAPNGKQPNAEAPSNKPSHACAQPAEQQQKDNNESKEDNNLNNTNSNNDDANDEKESKNESNDLLTRANKRIESDRSKLIFFGYTPREKMSKFISNNLPDNVQIDRSKWLNHRNWEKQTLLIKSHRNYRQSSQNLVSFCLNMHKAINDLLFKESTARKDKQNSISTIGSLIRDLGNSFYSINRSLIVHSNYEETKLFKYLAIRYKCPKLIELLLEDHHKLEEIETNIKNDISKFEGLFLHGNNTDVLDKVLKYNKAQKGNNTVDKLSETCLLNVVSFDETLVRHLGEEESVVLPMLLELSWNEYIGYYNARTYKEALTYVPEVDVKNIPK